MEVETLHFELRNDTKICQNVQEKQILSKLDECINNIARKEGYISCDVTKKEIPADGGNYLASITEIEIKGKTADGDKETAVFIKSINSECEAMDDILSVPGVYKTELFIYKELIPIFNELQDEANVPANERFNTVKFYEESYDKAIIMENISKKGFKVPCYRMDVITLKIAKHSIKELAKFHALSYALEKRKPDYFADKIKSIKYPQKFGEGWEKFAERFSNIGLECLDEELRSKIENKVRTAVKKLKEYYTDESIKSCLVHGDYRPNNTMIREVDGVVTVIPFDYQISSFGCPVFDFLYYIYMGTDRQFRKNHLAYLKNHYYKSFDNFLRYFDMTAESVLPRKIFEHIYEEKFDFGLGLFFLLGSLLFVSEDEEIPDITKTKMTDIELKLDDKFKGRIRDVVEEFIDLGYL